MRASIKIFPLVICLCISCAQADHPANSSFPSLVGKYMTHFPHKGETMALERAFGAQVYPLAVAMIYLREDSTYVLGFCNNEVTEAGRFRQLKDSLLLFDRYNLRSESNVPPRAMFYNAKKRTIYFVRPSVNEEKYKKLPEEVIPLAFDSQEHHSGFLRGEDLPLSSILHNYKLHSVDEQIRWTDSVLLARGLRRPTE